jgi:hypothetical protein
MPVGWFLAGIPQHWFIRFCRPIVEFVLIAPNTAIKQIIKAIITSLALWPKMVNRQLTTCICFTIFVFLTIDCQKNKILIPQNSQAKFARRRTCSRIVVSIVIPAASPFVELIYDETLQPLYAGLHFLRQFPVFVWSQFQIGLVPNQPMFASLSSLLRKLLCNDVTVSAAASKFSIAISAWS